ncbi:MAG TPA: hypothetical protein PKL08_06410 [Thermoanaerobaculaceae bacterium]|nr:hypothetical protein [Thermoanaerobaculaceae bacterium]
MSGHKLHLHSMIVHAVIALSVVGAIAFVCEATGATVGAIAPVTWAFLLRAALVGLLAVAVPATLSGIVERGHMYVNWHRSHQAKLALSLLLLAMAAGELAALTLADHPLGLASWLALAVVLGNPLVSFGLSFYGLRITLGRQALAGTSYVPDLALEPPVDILEGAAIHVAQRAAVIDVQEESRA